jgi:tRNA U34 5-methylaminomethyl-2-thiouridine-forming methyltransferase MnmC
MSIEIITTGDGSHSLRNHQLNETYHSVHGALRESVHVFIQHGLEFVLEHRPTEDVRILEIGFGTGLNALLTWQKARHLNNKIKYTTLEAYPVADSIWPQLNYAETDADRAGFQKLHAAKWNEAVLIEPNFELIKRHQTLEQSDLPPDTYDLIYYDAFAPSKQPELWTKEILEQVVMAMSRPSVFVTYCAKGQLKRDLRALGLEVETLNGPPGKKEMVRAKKV